MEINCLKLPQSFVRAILSGTLKREMGSWQLKHPLDFYGDPLETELGDVFENAKTILSATEQLPRDFVVDGYYGDDYYRQKPGFIPDIIDFSRIVHFGDSGDGAPFCFDFRENADEPSVIWWDDVYWRKVAPSFQAFLDLFELYE